MCKEPPGTKEHNPSRPFHYTGRYPGGKTAPGERGRPRSKLLYFWEKIGKGDANRTRDANLGKWSILCSRASHAVTPSSGKPLI